MMAFNNNNITLLETSSYLRSYREDEKKSERVLIVHYTVLKYNNTIKQIMENNGRKNQEQNGTDCTICIMNNIIIEISMLLKI